MCTTNNCLVERASTSLESRLEKRLALVDSCDNYYHPSQHSHIIDTVKSIGKHTSMDTVFQHVVKCSILTVTCSQKVTLQMIQECSQRSLSKTMHTRNTQHERIPTYTHMCTCTNTYTYTRTHHILTCSQILCQAQGHCGML